MKRFKLTMLALISLSAMVGAQTWTEIATDNSGDGNDPALLDGTKFEYYNNEATDSVWFRITTKEITASQEGALGVNIMVHIPGGGTTFNFWGTSNTSAWHKLVTAWVTGSAPSDYSGVVGVADAAGVGAMNWSNLKANNLTIVVSPANKTIIIGMKRSDLVTNSEMGGGSVTLKAAAAVGSNAYWNDDIYKISGSMTVTGTAGVEELEAKSVQVYPNPAQNEIHVQLEDLTEINTVTITDVTGAIVTEQTVSQSETNVNVSALENGIYFVSVLGQNGTTGVKRIVVNH